MTFEEFKAKFKIGDVVRLKKEHFCKFKILEWKDERNYVKTKFIPIKGIAYIKEIPYHFLAPGECDARF